MAYNWKPETMWKKRTKIIAKIIHSGSDVLDLGGGYENLNQFLNNCRYVSIDNFECTEDTVLADFNKGEFPDFYHKWDYLVCQGLIEYIRKPKRFLTEIQKYGDVLIITYRKNSPAPVWRNELSFKKLRDIIKESGWEIVMGKTIIKKKEMLYYCRLRK